MSGGHSHSFHLVEPSPWPALGAMSGFVAAVGAIMFIHDKPFGIPINLIHFNVMLIIQITSLFLILIKKENRSL